MIKIRDADGVVSYPVNFVFFLHGISVIGLGSVRNKIRPIRRHAAAVSPEKIRRGSGQNAVLLENKP